MYIDLISSTYQEFQSRFSRFCDSVFRSITVQCDDISTGLELRVSTRDLMEKNNNGWVSLTLTISGVTDYRIYQQINTCGTLTYDGFHFILDKEVVGIDFSGDYERAKSLTELRHSIRYVVGKGIKYEVLPYGSFGEKQ